MSTDQPLVLVFHAEIPELLPLAAGALEEEGIRYVIRRLGTPLPIGFGHHPEFAGVEGPADVYVQPADADRARDILADLSADGPAQAVASSAASTSGAPAAAGGPRLFRLTESESDAVVGDITAPQLQALVDLLEEESDTDRDYYIDAATIDLLAGGGADEELVGMLRRALGSRDGVDVRWTKL